MEDLFALEEWRSHSPDVPNGPWYKDFGSFKLCGQRQYPKTFLLKGQPAHGEEVEQTPPGLLKVRQITELAVAVGKLIHVDAQLVHHRHMKVGERRLFRVLHVPA